MAKSIFKSKTFWFNVIALANVVLAAYGISPVSETETAAGAAVINVILRLVSHQATTIA